MLDKSVGSISYVESDAEFEIFKDQIEAEQSVFIDIAGSGLILWAVCSFGKSNDVFILKLSDVDGRCFGDSVASELCRLLGDIKIVVADAKHFQTLWFSLFGVYLNLFADVKLLSYVVNPLNGKKDVESLLGICSRPEPNLSELAILYIDKFGNGEVDLKKEILEPASKFLLSLKGAFNDSYRQLLHQPLALAFYKEVDLPMAAILSEMERVGVAVDVEALRVFQEELAESIRCITKRLYDIYGGSFNVNSPKEILEKVFPALNVPIVGGGSTSGTDLKILQDMGYEIAGKIIEYRSADSILGKIVELLNFLSPITGRVHCSFMQTVTKTGRLSTREPNLQGLPSRSAEGRRIRKAIVASAGYCIIAADYSQVELRILAHLSGDEFLINAFINGDDIHAATASAVFGVPMEAVSSDERRRAKAINFGIIYGMTAVSLAVECDSSVEEAESFMASYFARLPMVRDYIAQTKRNGLGRGYSETITGRRIYVSKELSRAARERVLVNAPMQGSASDIVKMAMVELDARFKDCEIEARMIIQVHDELVLEVKEEHKQTAMDVIRDCMSNVVRLSVPLSLSIDCSDSWEESH